MHMKTLLIVILNNLFFLSVHSQPDPINITFVETQPKWEHLTYDTSFFVIGNQADINKYTVVTPHKCFRFNDDLVLLHYCTNYKGSIYGYILEKINALSGVTDWQNYSTYYNGGLQDFYKIINLRSDGFLEMQGIKRLGHYIDTIPFYWNTGGATSNFVRKIFDYQTGNLTDIIESQDSIVGAVPHYLNFFTIKQDSSYLLSRMVLNYLSDKYEYGHSFFPLDAFGNYVTSQPIGKVEYETTDSATVFSYGQPQFIKQINDTSWVCMLFKERFYPEKATVQLIWFTIDSGFNLQVTRRMQIEDLIPGKEKSFLYLSIDVANGSTYISQPYFNDSLNENATFLLCFDQDGNLIHNLSNCTSDGYRYNFVSRIFSAPFFDYFAAFPSRTGREGFDIVKLDRLESQFQFISSLTSAYPDEQFTRQMEVCRMYDDGLFVIGAYAKKIGQIQNSAVKYYGFDGKELGMNIPTSVKPVSQVNSLVTFPNPANEVLNFSIDGNIEEIRMYSTDGRLVMAHQNYSDNKIDISQIPPGIYFLTFQINKELYHSSFIKL